MATDPVQRIRAEEHGTAIDADLKRPLRRIANFPPSPDVPYLTVTVDWRPDGTRPSVRPGREIVLRKLDEIVAKQEPHSEAGEALETARSRIVEYLDGFVDPSTKAVYIVAGGEQGRFETLALGVPVETEVSLGPLPWLTPLAQVAEDNPPYAVLLADQKEADLIVINQAVVSGELVVEGSGHPRKQQQGGWSQRRYQMRADERVSAFARTVAEQTRRLLDEAGIDILILAGDDIITAALNDAWHPTVKERIVATVPLEIRSTDAEVIEATLPVAERAAREREMATVRRLIDGVGGPGAVGGVEHTLLALEEGRVMNLVLAEDFHADGWADFSLPVAGVGPPRADHPAGGDPAQMVPIALEDEMLRLAIAQDADVEIVRAVRPVEAMTDSVVPDAGTPPPKTEAFKLLDSVGGVGAILRYAIVDSGPAMPEA